MTAPRQRLPMRREQETLTVDVQRGDGGAAAYDISVGFDGIGRPKEVFLKGAKDGSGMAAILDDAAVALSVALQHGVSAAAMARSVGRMGGLPASVIGAALDLVAAYEREDWRPPLVGFGDG